MINKKYKSTQIDTSGMGVIRPKLGPLAQK